MSTVARINRIDRRTILRGMLGGGAVTLGMPLLDCMLDTAHSDRYTLTRFHGERLELEACTRQPWNRIIEPAGPLGAAMPPRTTRIFPRSIERTATVIARRAAA